jgi:hypothetical protein
MFSECSVKTHLALGGLHVALHELDEGGLPGPILPEEADVQ